VRNLTEKVDKRDVSAQVVDSIKQILAFKNIYKQREYATLEAVIQAEEQARLSKEQEELEAKENRSSQMQEASLKEQEIKDDKSAVTPKGAASYSKKSMGDASDRGPITGFGAASRKMGTTGMGSMGKKKAVLSKVQKIQLWEQMVKSYMRDGMVTLQEIKK
jgi:hypothetical protein